QHLRDQIHAVPRLGHEVGHDGDADRRHGRGLSAAAPYGTGSSESSRRQRRSKTSDRSYSRATSARPRAARAAASSGESSTAPITSASAAGSPGGTVHPVSPSRIVSRRPPTAVATTGTPHARASS